MFFFLLCIFLSFFFFFFSSRRRHTRSKRDWSSDVCSSDLSAADPLYSLLAAHALQLRALLIVSGVSVERASGSNGAASVHVEVARADGEKCERCWNYSVHVGENLKFPTICERCTAALNQMEKAAV